MQPGCVGLQVMVRVATASRAYGRSLRLRASSQAHYGVDEDEEWWPGRVLGVHSQGAHAGLVDVLYDDGALQPNLTLTLTQP